MKAPQEEHRQPDTQNNYGLNEEEARTLQQCRSESFWYRSAPLSVLGMVTANFLISTGHLPSPSRLVTFSRIAFGGLVGYIIGNVSYYNVCKEKFMKLENSPLGEKLRQEARCVHSPEPNAGYSYNIATLPSSPPVLEPPSTQYKSKAADVPFSASMSESSTTGITDHIAQEPEYYDEKAKPPPVTYEELRNKNRGVYNVQKPETPERPIQSRAPKIYVKKNQYGDVWEE